MESDSGGTLLVLEPKSLRSFGSQDEYLLAMKEDLADWFSCLHGLHVDADSFLEVLETGVLLCRHANQVQHFWQERRQQGVGLEMRSYFVRTVPQGQVVYRDPVKPGTFQARDNVSNFITWCRQLGIPDVLRFETDDLVLRKNERSVVLCMLELARLGARLGMPAPTIVRMEEEIDAELAGDPPPQIKTCDMKSLDELVRDLVGRCTCPVQFPMVKIGEGKYKIGDSMSLIFVRVLRKHVMVRVGGGWDTLEHYLDKHDPCRCNFPGHRGPASGPRHLISRRSSGVALVVSRTSAGATSGPSTPTSPRRMSSSALTPNSRPAPTHISTPAAGESHSVNEANSATRGQSPGPGGSHSQAVRRLSSPVPVQQQEDKGEAPRPTPATSLNSRRAQSPVPGRIPQPPRQPPSQAKHQDHQQHQAQRAHTPQHQAVQRCKSPSPGASSSHNVSPTLSGNRTIPRPVSRGPSGPARAQSPAPAQRQQLSMARSVSFDAPRSPLPADATSRSSDCLNKMADAANGNSSEGEGQEGLRPSISIEQISTMTLTEFKKLISSSLAVDASSDATVDARADNKGGAGGPSRGPGQKSDTSDLSWTSVRDKARSVCNSIASRASSRQSGAGGIIARRSLPKSPATDINSRPRSPSSGVSDRPKTPGIIDRAQAPPVADRTKTPAGVDRTKTPAAVDRPKTPAGVDRPKTPATVDRPKTPAAVDRPKTPVTVDRPKTPAKFDRPKTPAVVDRSKTPVAVERPKTAVNSVRPQTPSAHPVHRPAAVFDVEERSDRWSGVRGQGAASDMVESGAVLRQRPSNLPTTAMSKTIATRADITEGSMTPRVKNSCFVYQGDAAEGAGLDDSSARGLGSRTPSWTSSIDTDDRLSLTARRSQSPDDDADINSETDVNNSGLKSPGYPIRDRPPTPSRIPKPCFASRPVTPSSDVTPALARDLSRSATGRHSDDHQTAVTPRRFMPTPQSADTATTGEKGYVDRFHARRALTPGPTPSVPDPSWVPPRPVTPGSVSVKSRVQQIVAERRGSLSRVQEAGQLRKTRSVTNLLHRESSKPSDGHVSLQEWGQPQRAASSESVQRPPQTERQGCDVRDAQHHLPLPSTDGAVSHSSTRQKPEALQTRGPATESRNKLQEHSSSRREPRTVVAVISRKPLGSSRAVGRRAEGQDKVVNRTEAWVDSTLNDPKCRQLPSRPKRSLNPNSLTVHDSELLPRPLEEIQAVLLSPVERLPVPDPGVLEAPPEDPELYRKMEQLFEKYREKELRASVCDFPGGGDSSQQVHDGDSSSAGRSRSSGYDREEAETDKRRGDGFLRKNSLSSRSSSSMRTTASGSLSSSSPHLGSVNSERYAKDVLHGAAAAACNGHYTNGAASNTSQSPSRGRDDSASVLSPTTTPTPTPTHEDCGAAAMSVDNIVSTDAAIIHNPVALVSKIKEILQVRPRREDPGKGGAPTRIPGPAHLLATRRSRSFTNLACSTNGHLTCPIFTDNPVSDCGVLRRQHSADTDLVRDESTSSDVSSDVSRSETPVPKMAQPLTTGRSTLFRRERSGGALRAVSLDDRPLSSCSSHSSSSRKFLDDSSEYF